MFRLFLCSALVCFGLRHSLEGRWDFPFPDLRQVHWEPSQVSRDLSLLSLGMRRLAADVAFIQLLQYYGTPEYLEEESRGFYSELYGRSLRVLALAPAFRYAALYSAGALAFNLHRPDEAVALLEYALGRDPKQWSYHTYLAAIAYQKEKDFPRLIDRLQEASRDPDCPALFKNMLAGIYKKQGRHQEAIRIYRQLLESRDPDYRIHAQRELRKLIRPGDL